MRKYPYIILSFFLFLFLVVPFVLKLKDSRLEAYPAIIFPAGAAKVDRYSQEIINISTELYGCNQDLVKIKVERFLGGIKTQNFYPIIDADFGLEKYEEIFKLYKPPVTFIVKNNFNNSSVEETKNWLKERLKDQGLDTTTLIVRRYRNMRNIDSIDVVHKELIYEKSYYLD